MRLLMMGTGPFAVPTFCRLLDSPHEVAALVTRPVHGRRPQAPGPMRLAAEARGLALLEPESINAPEAIEALRRFAADLFVVCDYGQILSREALGASRLGGINLHASLLPKYRGAAPINWAIYRGERETGVTVIHMTPGLDAGPCLVQAPTPLGDDETAVEVEARLAEIGVDAVLRSIEILANSGGQPAGIVQDQSLATRAPRLKKTDGRIDWQRSARQIHNQVRGFQPWPKAYTFFPATDRTGTGGPPQRLIVEQTAVDADSGQASAGSIVEAAGDRLIVACGEGRLRLVKVQIAGKRIMSAEEFLRGRSLAPGTYFYDQPEADENHG